MLRNGCTCRGSTEEKAEEINLSNQCEKLEGTLTARQGRQQSIQATTEAKIMSSLNTSWWILSIHKFVRSLYCTDKLVFRATKAEELY